MSEIRVKLMERDGSYTQAVMTREEAIGRLGTPCWEDCWQEIVTVVMETPEGTEVVHKEEEPHRC